MIDQHNHMTSVHLSFEDGEVEHSEHECLKCGCVFYSDDAPVLKSVTKRDVNIVCSKECLRELKEEFAVEFGGEEFEETTLNKIRK